MGVNGDEYDKLELRNRTVTETLSPVDDLGQDPKDEKANGNNDEEEKYDELELRNRTVTETLSPLDDLGQDAKVANGGEKKVVANGKKVEENIEYDELDKLELRNRTVTETLSPVDDLGQDPEEPSPK